MYFRVATDRGDHPTWWLIDSDGQVAAWAGEDSDFQSLDDARLAAQTFKTVASTARYEVHQDRARQWRWQAHGASGVLAVSGEPFFSQLTARRAGAVVRDKAGSADGPWASEPIP